MSEEKLTVYNFTNSIDEKSALAQLMLWCWFDTKVLAVTNMT